MKKLSALLISFFLLSSCLWASNNSYSMGDSKIAGTLVYKRMEMGVEFVGRVELSLYREGKIFAKTELLNPRFPQAYLLGPKNAVVPGVPFEGEFEIRAQLLGEDGKKIAEAPTSKVLAGARDIMLIFKAIEKVGD